LAEVGGEDVGVAEVRLAGKPGLALFSDSFTISGLYSTPSARAPNLRAARIAILPSPEPSR